MSSSLATDSCLCKRQWQQLIRVSRCPRLLPMVADPKRDFARRLNALCDAHEMPQRGRRIELSRVVGVSGEAARKWLAGDAIPAMDHIVVLSTHFRVNAQWLLTGLGARDIGAGTLTDEELAHIQRLRCLPPAERARAFRVVDALVSPALQGDNAA